MTHCRSAAPPWRSQPIAGSPTLTTDPSTKARLEARMEAANTNAGYSWRASPAARATQTSPAVWLLHTKQKHSAVVLSCLSRRKRSETHERYRANRDEGNQGHALRRHEGRPARLRGSERARERHLLERLNDQHQDVEIERGDNAPHIDDGHRGSS